jgi:hypothetical protein
MRFRVAKTNANSWQAAAGESLHSHRTYEALHRK